MARYLWKHIKEQESQTDALQYSVSSVSQYCPILLTLKTVYNVYKDWFIKNEVLKNFRKEAYDIIFNFM